MSTTDPLGLSGPEAEKPIIEIDQPLNLRPDLSELGIEESERGVCLDSFENRSVLRAASRDCAIGAESVVR